MDKLPSTANAQMRSGYLAHGPQAKVFKVGKTAHVYPSFVSSDLGRACYRGICKFFIASTRQFWFFFGSWAIAVVIAPLRLQEYTFWILGALAIGLIVVTVMEWIKLSAQEIS